MKKIFYFAFLLLHFKAIGQEGVNLIGIVYYLKDPIENATVHLKNKNLLVVSDTSGKFEFRNIQTGKYILQVTAAGFEQFEQTINLTEQSSKLIKIDLQLGGSSLTEVVVSGTMKPVKKLESPIAVEVYTPVHFRKNPSPSIFESLQMVNGVRPQINCSVCNTGDVHINGLEGPYTMITIDGMPIVSSLSSVYGLFGIPHQLIDKVEIIKGPASGLYGSEAIGGLINIITKDPSRAPLFTINMMSTSWMEHNVDASIKAKIRNATSILGLNYFNYSKPYDKNKDNFTDVTLQHRISIFNKWNFQRKQNRIGTIAARYFFEDRWGGDIRWNKSFRGGNKIYGESILTNRWELIGNYQLPVNEKMFFSFSATAHDQNSYYGTTPYMANQKILFGQLLWDKTVANHDYLFGLAGRYNYYDDNSTATIDTFSKMNRPEKYFIPGLFVQDEIMFNPAHRFLLSFRIDHHPIHKAIFTPRLAYKWSINEQQTFRINAGTGFRVVNLFTEEHAALTGSRVVEVKESLNPEKSYNVNLNFTQQLGKTSRKYLLDASAWYTYFTNQILADYETDPNKIIYKNLNGYSISKGVSVNLDFDLFRRLKGIIGITLQELSKHEKDINGIKQEQHPVLSEKFSGTWTISYSMPVNGISIDYTGNVYSPMRLPLISDLDPRKPNSPIWSIQNVQVTKWISNRFEFFGGMKNLFNWTPARNNPFLIARSHDPFDKLVQYNMDGKVEATAENPYALTFDPAYVYAPNQGRRFYTGFRLKVQ